MAFIGRHTQTKLEETIIIQLFENDRKAVRSKNKISILYLANL